jgi:hypothetical protein
MKVTKAKGLECNTFHAFFALGRLGPAGQLEPPPQLGPPAHSAGLAARVGLDPAHVRWVSAVRYSDAVPSSALLP